MSLIKEIKETIAQAIFHFTTEPDQDPSDKVWADSELNISNKEVGGKVEIIDADGNLQDAPDGEYKMEDGTVLTVKDGLIAEIESADQEDAEKSEEDMAAADPEQSADDAEGKEDAAEGDTDKEDEAADKALLDEIQSLKQSIADLTSLITGVQNKQQDMASQKEVNELKLSVESLNGNIIKLAKIPVENSKTSKKAEVKDDKEAKLIEFAKALGKNR